MGVQFAVMNGTAPEYLWPGSRVDFELAFIYFVSVTSSLLAIFAQTFLNTRQYAPTIHKVISVYIGINILWIATTLLGWRDFTEPFRELSALSWPFLSMLSGILCWRRGYRPARYYVIAWSVPLAGMLMLVLAKMAVLEQNFFTLFGIQIGSAWEAVLFSLGLADRINLLRKEKENAELHAQTAELQARAAELQAQAIEAEDRRKSEELERGKQLQLSMLPEKPPERPDLDIAFSMRTASEVGGDYYDFHEDAAGTLTVALGDATGHGLQAGIVVTAAKSLFMALAPLPDIAQIQGDCIKSSSLTIL
jgi:hypothetical protein